jgi:ribonuclease BN (tRNA processing enzyme)
VISGDTSPCENIILYGQGVDILIHEVYSYKGFCAKNKIWQRYHATHHTSSIELGNIANMTKPKLLVLYHTLYWGATDAELLSEVKSVYQGEVKISSDLMVLS